MPPRPLWQASGHQNKNQNQANNRNIQLPVDAIVSLQMLHVLKFPNILSRLAVIMSHVAKNELI